MITSPDINKLLRRYLSPILRDNGFSKVSARKAWGWRDKCVRVLLVRAVGNHFSQVTGWPPMSVCVWAGVYYDFIPFNGHLPPGLDEKGRLAPDVSSCHLTLDLLCSLDQSQFTHQLFNPAEHERKDIWWLEPDGSNMVDVVENITLNFVDQGIPWLRRYTDLELAFADVELERDCYIKYYRASYLAKELGLEAKYKFYAQLRDEEEVRHARLFGRENKK
jgi:hypothetical protein